MKRWFLFIIICLAAANSCYSQSNKEVIKQSISKLHSHNILERRQAIMNLHDQGKASIPYLIEKIDDTEIVIFSMGHPWNSDGIVLYNMASYAGTLFSYMVELILARDALQETLTPTPFFFSNNDNWIYWDGVIERADKQPLNAEDMKKIKMHYKTWWKNNKEKSIEELREDWKNQKRPLSKTVYSWY